MPTNALWRVHAVLACAALTLPPTLPARAAPPPAQPSAPFIDDGRNYALGNYETGEHLAPRAVTVDEQEVPLLRTVPDRQGDSWRFEGREDVGSQTYFRLRNTERDACAVPGPTVDFRTTVTLGPCVGEQAQWRTVAQDGEWSTIKLLSRATRDVLQPRTNASGQLVVLDRDSRQSHTWWSVIPLETPAS